ncbi:MAG: hypothetical protein WCF92_00125 [bacterium]
MKNKINKKLITIAGGTVLSLSLVMPSFAQVTANVESNTRQSSTTRAQARQQNKEQKIGTTIQKNQTKGDSEIAKRITSLNNLLAKINGMKKLSDTNKASLSSTIETALTNLNSLKAKIDSDTSTTTLKEDLKSITANYRVYALVMPQVSLLAATDRIDTIAASLEALSTKLQTRISSAQGSGVDVTSANNSLADLNAKISDANAQALAINQAVSALTPDQGDKTKAAANTAAIKEARAKLKIAEQDLKTARADINSILKVVKQSKVKPSSTSTNN